MPNGEPNPPVPEGNETDPPVEKPKEHIPEIPKPNSSDGESSPLDRAEAVNKKKEELLEREEKLQDRKDKFLAEEKVGGRAKAGTPQTPEEKLKAEADERVNRIGRATGAQWAKKD